MIFSLVLVSDSVFFLVCFYYLVSSDHVIETNFVDV